MQESGMSSDTENPCNLMLKGKGLWKFLEYNLKKKETKKIFCGKTKAFCFPQKKKNQQKKTPPKLV